MKKSKIREMIKEEIEKLNEAHWHPKDNILDNITFEELITTVESNEKIIDEKSITKVFDDLMKAKISEAKFSFKQNKNTILKYINSENF